MIQNNQVMLYLTYHIKIVLIRFDDLSMLKDITKVLTNQIHLPNILNS